jgi:predicted GH43/DUF377 family glycosyl hydrolase
MSRVDGLILPLSLGACLAGVHADSVEQAAMQRVYEEARTPHKYGIVLRGENGAAVDCPGVFRHGAAWYMTYIHFDGSGYETRLARSEDLLDWQPLGPILSRRHEGWDGEQVAGFPALQDATWGGSYALEPFDGRYWMTYAGGALTGYETDPLSMGVAWSADPAAVREWTRAEAPILGPGQAGARYWERLTLYKSHVIRDPEETLGRPFVMYYNAKTESGYERIGMAVSRDMRTWERYGDDPVIDNASGISGDPQVVRMGDLWVMFYFGAFWRPGAFDTFACSRDLVHWTKWTGADLVSPSEPWDATYAHKPWLVKAGDTVYHFYCAVGDQGRAIALATSRDLRARTPQ